MNFFWPTEYSGNVTLAATQIPGIDITGATSSTDAVQAYLDAMPIEGGVVPLAGEKIRLGALTFLPDRPYTLLVSGELALDDTLVLPGLVDIIGYSGQRGAQWSPGQKGRITYGGTDAAIRVKGVNGTLLRNLAFPDLDATAIHVDSSEEMTAVVNIEDVDATCLVGSATALPMRLSSCYWINIRGGSLIARDGSAEASILIEDGPGYGSGAYSGLIRVKGTRFNKYGVRLNVAPGSTYFNYSFDLREIEFENAEDHFLSIDNQGGSYVSGIRLANITLPDTTGSYAVLHLKGRVRDVTIDSPSIASKLISDDSDRIDGLQVNGSELFPYGTGIPAFPERQTGGVVQMSGVPVYAQPMQPGATPLAPLPLLSPFATGAGGAIAPDLAPDGTMTATRLSGPADGFVQIHDAQLGLDDGDWLIFAHWIRGCEPGTRMADFLLSLDGSVGAELDGGFPLVSITQGEAQFGLTDAVWRFSSTAHKVTASGAADPYVRLRLTRTAWSGETAFWAPAVCLVKASLGASGQQVISWARSLSTGGSRPGTVSILPHQCLVSGRGPTAERPDAAAVGEGAQWYDVTLDLPLWSNGAIWRTACGTPV